MNSFILVAFFAVFAVASAGVIAPVAQILQGPSTRTTLVGPEGSVISSVAPGGQVVTAASPGVVAYSAPVVAAAAPVVSAYSAYSAPVVAGGIIGGSSVIAGPSGTVISGNTLAAPGVIAARSILI